MRMKITLLLLLLSPMAAWAGRGAMDDIDWDSGSYGGSLPDLSVNLILWLLFWAAVVFFTPITIVILVNLLRRGFRWLMPPVVTYEAELSDSLGQHRVTVFENGRKVKTIWIAKGLTAHQAIEIAVNYWEENDDRRSFNALCSSDGRASDYYPVVVGPRGIHPRRDDPDQW